MYFFIIPIIPKNRVVTHLYSMFSTKNCFFEIKIFNLFG